MAIMRNKQPRLWWVNAQTPGNGQPLSRSNSAILPADRQNKARIFCSRKELSFSAQMLKGRERSICQDTIAMLVRDDIIMAAVLDGHESWGHLYSLEMARCLVRLARHLRTPTGPDAKQLIIEAAKAMPFLPSEDYLEALLGAPKKGGTTVTVALLGRDRRYSIATLGDSPPYLVGHGSAKRLSDSSCILDIDRKDEGGRLFIGKDIVQWDDYLEVRNYIFGAVNGFVTTKSEIQVKEGELERGMKLVLVSDGITKNLSCVTDLSMNVLDVSGNLDMARIMRDGMTLTEATSRLLSVARSRADGKSGPTFRSNGERLEVVSPADDDMTVIALAAD